MIQDNVQYAYAVQDDNKSVNIHSLTREMSSEHKYYCPNCHGEMYPTFGEIQYHHFRHNGTQCQHDNYLHSLAEHIFLEEYVWCLENKHPFILEMQSSVHCDRNCVEKKNRLCTKHKNTICVDLTQIYTKAQLETNVLLEDGRYRRPDILLTSENGEQLWVEIWVKHETIEDKRKDGNIVELKISSEKDLEQIKKHKITKTTDDSLAVRIFNVEFDDKHIVDRTCHDSSLCVSYRELIQYRKPYRSSSSYSKRLAKPIFDIDLSDEPFNVDGVEWVDIGLPSGTLWAKEKVLPSLSLHNARNRYLAYLPTKSQVQELRDHCERYWNSQTKDYQLTGPNGNSLSFPCKEKNVSYWLKDYEDRWKEDGQRFVIGQDGTFWINDADATSLFCVRLVRNNRDDLFRQN